MGLLSERRCFTIIIYIYAYQGYDSLQLANANPLNLRLASGFDRWSQKVLVAKKPVLIVEDRLFLLFVTAVSNQRSTSCLLHLYAG
ncbi:hypothetical protein DI53_3649 [Sphingobacterium deserti]|uniref:Uncharacterized protein n=1 Tax=Sphingobacterium deserti TaxID=1229276 RepID=A0A0B8T570_9SPHI|nr:hypothetical protein DI53_3649 [Sphingobacterium deserti]